jgi:hypothetical protein
MLPSPKAKVAHYFSGSARSREVDARKLYYCHRNLLRAILKNCGSSLTWALSNFFLFTLLMIAGFLILEPAKAAAAVRAVFWNLSNFRETYSLRLKTQTGRIENEAVILAKMYPGLTRHQPSQHMTLRRVVNILFEYSQLPQTSQPNRCNSSSSLFNSLLSLRLDGIGIESIDWMALLCRLLTRH